MATLAVASSTSKTPAKKAPVKAKVNGKSNGVSIPKPTTTGKGTVRKLYKYSGTFPENVDKFTAQMLALIETVAEAKKGELDSSSFTAQECVKLAVKNGFLSTRQDPLRIFRFYKNRLVDEGYFIVL